MAERYTKVFAQSEQYYCAGAPVIIQAGALLKDNQKGKLIAQIKFKNITAKPIRALTVRVFAQDVSGAELAGVDKFQYLDLNVPRDGEFGAKTPIFLPDAFARSFSCQCLSAVFADGTSWECESEGQWEPLPAPVLLKDAIGQRLIEQYRRDTKTKAEYKVTEHEDLWYCGCGEINRAEEGFCHKCGVKKRLLTEAENVEILSARQKEFDAALAAYRAEQMHRNQEQKRENRKIMMIAGAIVATLCIVVSLCIGYAHLPSTKYKKAVSLMEQEYFPEAEKIFAEISSYKDAQLLEVECRWQQGLALFVAGNYEDAYRLHWSILFMAGATQPPDHIVASAEEYLRKEASKYIEQRRYRETVEIAGHAFGNMDVDEEIFVALKEAAFEKVGSDPAQTMEICTLLEEQGANNTVAQTCREEITEELYLQACTLFDESRYTEAVLLAEYLGDYKDAPDLKNRALTGQQIQQFSRLEVGGVGTFGTYEQDNNYKNGTEALEWVVLDKQENGILLISKNVIDCYAYSQAMEDTTWESSDLRKWLNDGFLKTSFGESDLEKIATTTVVTGDNPESSVSGGNDTKDRVFILSVEELETYFPVERDRLCEVTPYAQKRADAQDCNWIGQWLLRTPGSAADSVTRVLQNGSILMSGFRVDRHFGIRPAIWISLESA